MAKLDGLVLTEISELLDTIAGSEPTLRSALRRAWVALSQPTNDDAAMMRSCEQSAAKARERIKRLALLFADGDIDREGYELGRAQAQADLEAAEMELGKLRPSSPAISLPSLDEVLGQANGWREVLAGDDIIKQRDVLGALVTRVLCERVSFGRFRVSLIWSEVGDHLRGAADTVAADVRVA